MYAAIDIGGTAIKYALLDDTFHIQKKWQRPTLIFAAAAQFYDYVCRELLAERPTLIGVSMPGILSKTGQVISNTSRLLNSIFHTNPNREISQRLHQVPVAALNDARAAGTCEVQLGNGRHTASSLYWLIGTAIGGASFQGTQLITGQDNFAGEFSHLPITIENNRTVGLAKRTGIPALIKGYNARVAPEQAVHTGQAVTQRWRQQDPAAQQALDQWTTANAQALLMLTMILNPEVICLGGAISADQSVIDLINTKFHTIQQPFSALMTTELKTCRFKNDANLIGATLFAAQQFHIKGVF
jgi:predicted NBD/HSP70 family sugar kinase